MMFSITGTCWDACITKQKPEAADSCFSNCAKTYLRAQVRALPVMKHVLYPSCALPIMKHVLYQSWSTLSSAICFFYVINTLVLRMRHILGSRYYNCVYSCFMTVCSCFMTACSWCVINWCYMYRVPCGMRWQRSLWITKIYVGFGVYSCFLCALASRLRALASWLCALASWPRALASWLCALALWLCALAS